MGALHYHFLTTWTKSMILTRLYLENINVCFITICRLILFCFFGLKLKTENDFSYLFLIRDALKIKCKKPLMVADKNIFLKQNNNNSKIFWEK